MILRSLQCFLSSSSTSALCSCRCCFCRWRIWPQQRRQVFNDPILNALGLPFQTRLLGRVPWQGFPVDLPVPGRKLSNTQQFPTLWEKMQENSVYSSKLPCLISGLAPGPSSQDPVSKNPADSIIQKPHSTVKVGFHRSSGWFLAIFWLWVKSRVAYTTKNCCLVAGQWCFCSSKYQWIAGFF